MNYTHNMTLGEAAKATGKSKTTISKYIKNGRLSVVSKSEKGYRIDPSELFRVFTPINSKQGISSRQSLTPKMTPDTHAELLTEIAILKVKLDAETKRANELAIEKEDWKGQAQKLLLHSPLQPEKNSIFNIFTRKKTQ